MQNQESLLESESEYSSSQSQPEVPADLASFAPQTNLFNFMNKGIDEGSPSTFEELSSEPEAKQPQTTNSKGEDLPSEMPRPKPFVRQFELKYQEPPKKKPEPPRPKTKFEQLQLNLLDPVEMLKVTSDYDHLISRNKKQAKRDKMLQRQRQRQVQSRKHRTGKMEMVFNAVYSYFN